MAYNIIYRVTGPPLPGFWDPPLRGHARIFIERLHPKVVGPSDRLGISVKEGLEELMKWLGRLKEDVRTLVIHGEPREFIVYKFDADRIAFRYALEVDADQEAFVTGVLSGEGGWRRNITLVKDSPYVHLANCIQRTERCEKAAHRYVKDGKMANNGPRPRIPDDHVRVCTTGRLRHTLVLPHEVFAQWTPPRARAVHCNARFHTEATGGHNTGKGKGKGKGRGKNKHQPQATQKAPPTEPRALRNPPPAGAANPPIHPAKIYLGVPAKPEVAPAHPTIRPGSVFTPLPGRLYLGLPAKPVQRVPVVAETRKRPAEGDLRRDEALARPDKRQKVDGPATAGYSKRTTERTVGHNEHGTRGLPARPGTSTGRGSAGKQ